MGKRCVIVGAGVTGLFAGNVLQKKGIDVILLDKGKGIGGRLATKALGEGIFDYGAQHLSVRADAFARDVAAWEAAGIIKLWSAMGFPLPSQTTTTQAASQDEEGEPPRYCGVGREGMRRLTAFLSQGLHIESKTCITSLRMNGDAWQLGAEDGRVWDADAVILTPPVPQGLALLEAGEIALPQAEKQALEAIQYAPSFSLLAQFSEPSAIPPPGGIQFDTTKTLLWIGDNHQKGVSPTPGSLTLHATPLYSLEHLEAPRELITQDLLEAAAPWVRGRCVQSDLHRWLYAFPLVLHPAPYLQVQEASAPLFFAGDAFGGPRVEGAAFSGRHVAEKLASLLS